MMIRRNPHILQYNEVTKGYEDENGDYHKGTEKYVGNIECNCVPAGKSNERIFDDGIVRTYSYTIKLDKDCREFSLGDKIKIILLNGIEREYTVAGFHRYQLSAKLWV